MAKFSVGDHVYVPSSSMSSGSQLAHALVRRTVQATTDRSIVVDDLGGPVGATVKVASVRVHSSALGFLVLRIGDLTSESALLDPLAKSVLQFLRLLVPDDQVRSVGLRTMAELSMFWAANHGAFSHVVLIGHSGGGTISFVDEGAIGGKAFAEGLAAAAPAGTSKVWASMACSTGRASFAKDFSDSEVCSHLAAPYGVVHGAAASHFSQSFLLALLLNGQSPVRSFKTAAGTVMGETHFRLWTNGKIKAGKDS